MLFNFFPEIGMTLPLLGQLFLVGRSVFRRGHSTLSGDFSLKSGMLLFNYSSGSGALGGPRNLHYE